MIKVRLEKVSMLTNYCAKTLVTCPQCENVDFFYNFISKSCPECDFVWGNIAALVENINVRKYYHRNGEIG